MTTGETIISVILILLSVIGPFTVFIWYALKYSKETFDPLLHPRTYYTSAKYFFWSIDFVKSIYLIAFGVVMLTLLLTKENLKSVYPIWTVYALYGSLVVLSFGAAALWLTLQLNYWKFSKGRVLSFDPEARTLTVQVEGSEYIIREDNVERVDIFSNEGYRNLYEYYQFTLRGGRCLIITDRTKGAAAIFDFFRELPLYRHKRRVPLISASH